jgi:polyhydroxyalkanoate synthesis regulator phasin
MERGPQSVRRELTELIQRQIDNIEKETFGGATDVERREYEEMRKRIDELRREFERFNTAA